MLWVLYYLKGDIKNQHNLPKYIMLNQSNFLFWEETELMDKEETRRCQAFFIIV